MGMRASRLTRYAWGVLMMNLAVVLWGAVVRATGSGAGCGRHWPRCNGQMLPELASAKTLVEYSHRASSGIAFLLVAALLVAVLRTFPAGHPARRGAVAAMVFMVMEALAGAGLVWFELVADDKSAARAMSLAIHLVITFFLLGSIALTAWWCSGRPAATLRDQGRRGAVAIAGAAGVLVIGITGAMTALGDTLFPRTSIGLDLGPTAHFLERLRVVHPITAVCVGARVVLAARGLSRGRGAETGRLALGVGLVYASQLAAGMLNLILHVPLWMQLIHLALADVLWVTFVLTAASALASSPAPSEPT
jgi:heme A synthase